MKLSTAILAVIFVLLFFGGTIVNLLGDWFWFQTVGYDQVFLTIVFGNLGLGILAGLAFLTFAFLNISIARRRIRKRPKKSEKKADQRWKVLIIVTLLISLFVGSAFANWQVFLNYLNSTPFGVTDPVFGMDVGFYVFELPFFSYLFGFVVLTLIITILLTFATYLLYSAPERKLEEI